MKNRANIQRMIACIDKIQTYCAGVNLILVWDIINDDVPKLRMALEKI